MLRSPPLIVRKENRLGVSEKGVLRIILGHKGDEEIGSW
jgi:hypothetical protein